MQFALYDYYWSVAVLKFASNGKILNANPQHCASRDILFYGKLRKSLFAACQNQPY